ncbi:hypothetical protein KIW84_070683 [Lathyrus oleraceus]|uniref:Aspergillus nuclease S1 n=1 Tax=Pisum sativum TaxID=3888 RepID=A0A9D4VGB0_PEA|nr:hypothetical protein KIW84_070683 [Pisum sativum]
MRIMVCQVFVHGLIASSLLFVGRLFCISLTLLLSFAISNMPVGYPTLKAFAEFVTQFDMPSGIKLKKKDTDSFEFGRAFCPVMFEDHDEVADWEACSSDETTCPNVYASEGVKDACQYAYKDAPEDATLEDDYFLSCLPIISLRLAQGGVRLAATLNRIFQ